MGPALGGAGGGGHRSGRRVHPERRFLRGRDDRALSVASRCRTAATPHFHRERGRGHLGRNALRAFRPAHPLGAVALGRASSFQPARYGRLLPLVAKVELHRDSTGFGLLLGCLGVGSIIGALMSASIAPDIFAGRHGHCRGGAVRRGEHALAYLASFGAVALALVVSGVAWMTVNSTLTTRDRKPRCRPGCARARWLFIFWSSKAPWRSAA